MSQLAKEKENDLRTKSQEISAKEAEMEDIRTKHNKLQAELKGTLENTDEKLKDLENQLETAKSSEAASKQKLSQVRFIMYYSPDLY